MVTGLKGKKVLLRVDFNVPLDPSGKISDDTRIRMALATILHLLDEGAAVVLMSHLGRPLKKLLPDGSVDREKFSLRPVAEHLGKLMGRSVRFVGDCVGPEVEAAVAALQEGEVLLLENTRFYAEETKGDPEFAKKLASLGDVYINDAFGAAHREHASTATVARFFTKENKGFGFLMESELKHAEQLMGEVKRPFVAIVGGAKVSDKISLLEALLGKADDIVIGGAMAYTFVRALGGKTGASLVEEDKLALAGELLEKARAAGVKLHLPADTLAGSEFSDKAQMLTCATGEIPDGWMGLDIGPEALAEFSGIIRRAGSILWNGPMGVFEIPAFAVGTMGIAKAVAETSSQQGAFSLVGGGDSVAAVNQSGLSEQISFISTGGGAMLELLEGKELPGIAAVKA